MRRAAPCLTALVLSLSLVCGCSTIRGWFGGKKTDPYADAYDQSMSAPAANTYPAYEPLPTAAYPSTTYATNSGSRYHTVAKKDTLYSIARVYYNGDHTKWREIYEANRAEISDPNRIRVGQRLVIP